MARATSTKNTTCLGDTLNSKELLKKNTSTKITYL